MFLNCSFFAATADRSFRSGIAGSIQLLSDFDFLTPTILPIPDVT